jgi:hypothetical protein
MIRAARLGDAFIRVESGLLSLSRSCMSPARLCPGRDGRSVGSAA